MRHVASFFSYRTLHICTQQNVLDGFTFIWNNLRSSLIRLPICAIKIVSVIYFRTRSFYAAQSIVNPFVARFRNQPADQQPIAQLHGLFEKHKIGIAVCAALSKYFVHVSAVVSVLTSLLISLFSPQLNSQANVYKTLSFIFKIIKLLSAVRN